MREGSFGRTPRSSQEHWPGSRPCEAGCSAFWNLTVNVAPCAEAMPPLPMHRIANTLGDAWLEELEPEEISAVGVPFTSPEFRKRIVDAFALFVRKIRFWTLVNDSTV